MSLEASIELETSTPASVGWYEPSKQDPIGIRASEIKGLWRWWSRTCIAGAMYDLGLLSGYSGGGILLKPRDAEVEAISCFVGKILGLGYVGEGGSEASRFVIHVDARSQPSLIRLRDLERHPDPDFRSLQRPRLLTLRQKVDVEGIDWGHRFTLVVRRRASKYSDAEELALRILYMAVQLSGVGKGSRRGMGSLDIVGQGPGSAKFRDIRELIESVYSDCIKVVEKYKGDCVKYEPKQRSDIPPLPALSKRKYQDTINVARVYVAEGVKFSAIHNFFLRSERCRVLHGNPKCMNDLRNDHAAWVLGLPREGRVKLGKKVKRFLSDHGSEGLPREQLRTGYLIESPNVSRRASPIIISYHSEKNVFGPGAFISVFLSGDWPETLRWCGIRQQDRGSERDVDRLKQEKVDVDFQRLVRDYRIAINELERYLNAVGAQLRAVWP